MRLAILGNSGSGKSTLACWLAAHSNAPMLDLDTVAWESGQIAIARPIENARADVQSFCTQHDHWVIEGCYASLIDAALGFTPRLILINPGLEQCLANCRARPWERHKYPSRQAQDERLTFLLSWVAEYYTRTGDMSLQAHSSCFENYTGPKVELEKQPLLEPPSAEVSSWLVS